MDNMQTVFNRIGGNGDTTPNTLFGQLYNINQQIQAISPSSQTASVATILQDVQSILSTLGTTNDTAANVTVMGNIKSVQSLIGTSASTSTTTLFGSLNGPNSNVVQASNNAAAAMSLAQQIINDLGVNGATPNVYVKLKNLEDDVANIQQSATQLIQGTANTPGLTQQSIDNLNKFLADQAKKAGLQQPMTTNDLSAKESRDMEKVNEKLEEINAKIAALREAMNVQDVVVKSWYESE
jgi:predicted transcriptional regulator